MAGFRWRASSVLTMFAVLALCISVQHAPMVSAKDKAKTETAASATDAEADSSAVPEDSQSGAVANNCANGRSAIDW
jgi:hypothetical protein